MENNHVQKIVSLLPSATEIVCALGLEDKLVGVTHECDFPLGIDKNPHLTASRINHESMSSHEIDHAVRTQLDGHSTIYDLDEKMLGELSPDLILTQELCDVCAVNYEIVKKSAKVWAADATIVSLEPTTIEEVFENIITVGRLCGIEGRAEELVNALRLRLKALADKLTDIPERPEIFMLEWLDPAFAPGHWVPEQVEHAGGKCLLGEKGQRSITIEFDQIVAADPDVIALIPCGFYIEDIQNHLKTTTFPRKLRETKAFKNNQIYALDATSYFSRPGPRVVDGAEILAQVVHPNVFGEPLRKDALKIDAKSLKFETGDAVSQSL